MGWFIFRHYIQFIFRCTKDLNHFLDFLPMFFIQIRLNILLPPPFYHCLSPSCLFSLAPGDVQSPNDQPTTTRRSCICPCFCAISTSLHSQAILFFYFIFFGYKNLNLNIFYYKSIDFSSTGQAAIFQEMETFTLVHYF